jgi:hypothetical protein
MFGKLFGKRPLEALFAEAGDLEARGELGEAKLAFDRAADRGEREAPARAPEARSAADRCCDGIAKRRVREAERLVRDGAMDLARDELGHAIETARSKALRDEARALLASLAELPRGDAVLDPTPSEAGPSNEELLALVMGSWSAPQTRELESYGEPLFEALLAGAKGQKDARLKALRSLAERAAKPIYLRLELADAALAASQPALAEEALRSMLGALGDAPADEHAAACLTAHRMLAQLCHDRGDALGAEQELTAACEALLDDPRPYLDLGHYLRTLGRAAEAVEVLELGANCFAPGQAEWPVLLELGLARLQRGDREGAHEALQGARRALEQMGATELPAELAAALASLAQ